MKKTTAFALALVILAMLFAAIGCVNVNPGKNPSGSADKDGDDWDLNRFSDIDLNGATVRMMSRAHERHANELTVDDEDEPKDFVLAEIYNRERYVEEKLHVRIENDKVESTDEHGGRGVLPALVLSNDQTYDVYASSYYATSGLAIDGNFSNVYDVRSIDTERGYWSQYFIEKAQIGKNLYFFTGDAAISALRFLFVTFFNKNMVEEYKIDDPYVLVKNGAWTYDAMYDIVKDIYVDLNNDQIADENDFYGLAVNNYLGSDAYTSAFNLTTVAVNGNHQAEVVVNVNKYTKAVEMVYDLFWKTPGVLCGQDPSYLANILA
ncbi:MAG: hypothetical protein J5563_07120 [Clostridia bacterium]|nr:hypothetical protein [Clostridia bacterium]